MATLGNSRFSSHRRSKTLGLLVAGGILFAIGFGGPGALWASSMAEVTSSS